MPDIMKMGKNPNYLGSWDLDELPGRYLYMLEVRAEVEGIDLSPLEGVDADGNEEKCTAAQ